LKISKTSGEHNEFYEHKQYFICLSLYRKTYKAFKKFQLKDGQSKDKFAKRDRSLY